MTRIVILAAGKGKRMGGGDLPKVLRPLSGRPILAYVFDAVRASGIDARPVLVVGHLAEKVREICGSSCEYAEQELLRGTGDAVRSAMDAVGSAEHIMVLNGDMPFVSAQSIQSIVEKHKTEGAAMTMGIVEIGDFEGWRSSFSGFGRIVRDDCEEVKRIIEAKDATPEELAIREVNPGLFCFRAEWLWFALETLTTENAQGEYYLTDLLVRAVEGRKKIATVPIPTKEAIGINTPEQLRFAETLIRK